MRPELDITTIKMSTTLTDNNKGSNDGIFSKIQNPSVPLSLIPSMRVDGMNEDFVVESSQAGFEV